MKSRLLAFTALRKMLSPALAVLIFSLAGCLGMSGKDMDRQSETLVLPKSIAVVGFSSAIGLGDDSRTMRSPLTGFVFEAEPVVREVTDLMSGMLFERLVSMERFNLYSPEQTNGVLAGLLQTAAGLSMPQDKLFIGIGKRLEAEAVLTGLVFRWQEREGKQYGVNRAASVAFDLQLISTADGSVIWRDKFDKTQRSLSEDLFDLGTFLKARGRWMSARELADSGLERILKGLSSYAGDEPSLMDEIDRNL